MYRKKRGNHSTMVRRYCQTLDIDYMKNKITVVAYMNHIMDMYTHQRKPFMRTLASQLDHKSRVSSAYARDYKHVRQ